MNYMVSTKTRGIENSVTNLQLVQNGTFFNNTIAPQIGYIDAVAIRDPNKRRKFGLPMVEPYPPLTRECTDKCMDNYVGNSSDWVDVETVISTSSDQTAIAPGSLIEEWKKDGRNYRRFRLDHRSLNFYSFISARYAVERDKVGDVDLEVYYHPEHRWNVPKMIKSMQQSLPTTPKTSVLTSINKLESSSFHASPHLRKRSQAPCLTRRVLDSSPISRNQMTSIWSSMS